MQFTRVAVIRANEAGEVNDLVSQVQSDLQPQMEQAPGFISYGLALDSQDPSRIISVSRWEDEESARQGANRIQDWMQDSGVAQKVTIENEMLAEYAFRTEPSSQTQSQGTESQQS